MPPVEFELTTPTGERPQTYALDRAATGIGTSAYIQLKIEIFYTLSMIDSRCAGLQSRLIARYLKVFMLSDI